MEAWREAVLAHDLTALGAVITDDAELHSPITERIPFKGRKRLLELFEDIFSLLGPMEIVREVSDGGDRRFLEIRAELAGYEMHQIQMLKLDAGGKVEDVTLFMRPMPGVVNLAAHLAPKLVRRRFGRVVGFLVGVSMMPLAIAVRVVDRISPRFV